MTFFIEKNKYIVDIACGSDFTLALEDGGTVYSFGNNELNQLGREFTVRIESTPKQISFNSEKIIKICAGWKHGITLMAFGDVYMWGNPYIEYHRKFPNIVEPTKVENLDNITDIASGFHHFVALRHTDVNKEVFTWGANDYGQLGFHSENQIIFNPRALVLTQFLAIPVKV